MGLDLLELLLQVRLENLQCVCRSPPAVILRILFFYWLHTYSHLWIKDLKKRFFCDLLVLMVRRKQSVRRAHPVHYLVCPSVRLGAGWLYCQCE